MAGQGRVGVGARVEARDLMRKGHIEVFWG